MIVVKENAEGRAVIWIDAYGVLAWRQKRDVHRYDHGRPGELPRAIFQQGTTTALDGSRITYFSDRRGEILIRHVEPSGSVWWSATGTLTTLRDIDAVRKELRVAAPPRATDVEG